MLCPAVLALVLGYLPPRWRRAVGRRVSRAWNAAVRDPVRLGTNWEAALFCRTAVLPAMRTLGCLAAARTARLLEKLDVELLCPQRSYEPVAQLRLDALALRLRGDFSDAQVAEAVAAVHVASLVSLTLDATRCRAGRAATQAVVAQLRPGASEPPPERPAKRRKKGTKERKAGCTSPPPPPPPPPAARLRSFSQNGYSLALRLGDCRIDDGMLEAIAYALFPVQAEGRPMIAAPPRLREWALDVNRNYVTARGAAAVAEAARRMRGLRTVDVDLNGNPLAARPGDAGPAAGLIAAFLAAEHVRDLTLSVADTGLEGVAAALRAPTACLPPPSQLRRLALNLSGNRLSPADVAAVCAAAAGLPHLEEAAVDVSGNALGAAGLEGVAVLCAAPGLKRVSYAARQCALDACGVAAACRAVAGSPCLTHFTVDVQACRLEAAAAHFVALLESFSLTHLDLRLRQNLIADEHTAFLPALFQNAPRRAPLEAVAVDVDGNYISAKRAGECRAAAARGAVPRCSVTFARSAVDPRVLHGAEPARQ